MRRLLAAGLAAGAPPDERRARGRIRPPGHFGVFGENIAARMALPAFRSADGQAEYDKASTTFVLLFSEISLQSS